jgi:hypothetical protein
MLDSPEGVCPGQARFEYPATSVLFSNRKALRIEREPVRVGQGCAGQFKVAADVGAEQVNPVPGGEPLIQLQVATGDKHRRPEGGKLTAGQPNRERLGFDQADRLLKPATLQQQRAD